MALGGIERARDERARGERARGERARDERARDERGDPEKNMFLQFWKDSGPNSSCIFLMSRFKSTRLRGFVMNRLGGRVMNQKWKLLKIYLGGDGAPGKNMFLQFWKDSLLNSGLIFLMSRFKSTRVSGNVIIRLGGRVMKKKNWKLLKTHLGGPVPWSP